MKRTVKTKEILNVYQHLGQAKYGKLSDEDKIKVWKIARKLKPIAQKFEEDSRDCAEKMKPTDDFTERLQKAQEYERLKQQNEPTIDVMTTAEYDAFIAEFRSYQKLVDKAIKEMADVEVDVCFEPISEESFGQLMASNEWTMAQAATIGDFICEK